MSTFSSNQVQQTIEEHQLEVLREGHEKERLTFSDESVRICNRRVLRAPLAWDSDSNEHGSRPPGLATAAAAAAAAAVAAAAARP